MAQQFSHLFLLLFRFLDRKYWRTRDNGSPRRCSISRNAERRPTLLLFFCLLTLGARLNQSHRQFHHARAYVMNKPIDTTRLRCRAIKVNRELFDARWIKRVRVGDLQSTDFKRILIAENFIAKARRKKNFTLLIRFCLPMLRKKFADSRSKALWGLEGEIICRISLT
jgi:hypothetical protein